MSMRRNLFFFLVDDDVDDQEFFVEALKEIDENIQCTIANDGLEAIEKLKLITGYTPDYIFLDQNMPRMSGLQCLRELKEIDRLQNAKVIMYSTSLHVHKDYEEATQLGVHHFFKKTPSFSELVSTIRQLLHNDAMLRQ